MKVELGRVRTGWLADAAMDARLAVRTIRRSPGFSAVVVLTMALGVGTTTTLFSLSYGVLMRPLPWPESDRLVRLQETRGGHTPRIPWTVSNGTYLAWREAPQTIEEIGGSFRSQPMTFQFGNEPERLPVASVTPSLFRVLRAQPAVGRLFVDDDAASGQPHTIVLSYGLWQRRFGGRRDVIGQALRVDERSLTVIGILPPEFLYPNREAQAWVPSLIVPVNRSDGNISLMIFSALARLRPGVTREQAQAEATARALGAPDPKQAGLALFGGAGAPSVTVAPAADVLTSEVRPALLLLLAAVALLFVAATASLLVLQLTRAATRRRESAVRAAIGAGHGRLTRHWLVEALLLGFVGGATGLLVAIALHRLLPSVLPTSFPRLDDVRLDWRVAGFACAVTVVASVLCGLVPAHRRRESLTASLTEESAGSTPTVTRTPLALVRTALMAGQVAIACVLLVGAALLLRSLSALVDTDRGFDPRGVLTARLALPPQSTFEGHAAVIEQIQARIGGLPGVDGVAVANALPFVTPGGYQGLRLESSRDPSGYVDVQTISRAVSPEYFRAMGLRVVDGRTIEPSDTATAPRVVVVNRTFAARYLDAQPVGRRITSRNLGENGVLVVGVVDDMRQGTNLGEPDATFGGLADPPQPEMFFAHRQWSAPFRALIVAIKTTGSPAALAPAVREVLRAEAPAFPVDSLMTMDDRVILSLAGPRTYAVFVTAFALAALAIAGVGLFGVLAYGTAQRTREFGIRTAIGARRRDVVQLVLRRALTIGVSGVLAGLAASWGLSRLLTTLLYGVSPQDAMSFVVVPLVLVAVTLLAAAVPAWRAAQVDPLVALRSE